MNVPQTAYDWFARSAATHGYDVTALEVGEERLSYGELRDLAERLAARLVAASGGTPPRRVGLLASRSVPQPGCVLHSTTPDLAQVRRALWSGSGSSCA